MNTSTNKKKKQKSFIRTGAVIPFVLISAFLIIFSVVFLDSILKSSMEMIGTKINGAQVDIGSVETSLKKLSIKISKIEVTNKLNPEFNSFEVGQVHFEMLWDALLRAKIVINEVKVADILINTKRKKRGNVVPPPSAAQLTKEDQEMKDSLLKVKDEFKGNVFGDIAGVVAGDKIESETGAIGSLKSKKKISELSSQITIRQEKIEKMMRELPPASKVKELEQRLNSIKWKDLSNIAKAPKTLKELDGLKKDADKITKAYNDANKAVNKHLAYVSSSKKMIDGFVEDDIKDLKNKMKIPALDTKSIASKIFGPEVVSKIEIVQAYHAKYKRYFPKVKTKEEKLAKKNEYKVEREVGVNYAFGKTNSYPMLWIKNILINSKNEQGEISGSIKDITSNQALIDRPTVMTIDGDFPGIDIRDVLVRGSLDHRTIRNDKLLVEVGSYPVANKALSDSEEVTFIIKKASTRSLFKADFGPKKVSFVIDNYFSKIDYTMGAKSKIVTSLLDRVAKTTDTISLKASAAGKMNNLDWTIKSNLAQAIENAAKQEVNEKLKAVNDKIKKDVEMQIAQQKKSLESQTNEFKSKAQSQINDAKKKVDEFKSKINKKKKEAEKKGQNSAKDLFKNIKL